MTELQPRPKIKFKPGYGAGAKPLKKRVRRKRLPPAATTRGDDNIAWIEEYCFIPEGKHVMKPVKLRDWQRAEIKKIYDNPLGTRRAIISFGRKNAKALAIDTQVATPRGWSTMGMLKVGDEVFDERGQTCKVTAKSPVFIGHKCYRLVFADGSSIIADEGHLWETRHAYRPWAKGRVNGSGNGGKWRVEVVNTAQIADSVHRPRRDAGREHNHKVCVADALVCPQAELPISPYVLGYWLGNGNTDGAIIHVGRHDELQIVEEVQRELGFELSRHKIAGDRHPRYGLTTGRGPNRSESIQAKLRAVGVLGNKHIPEIYQWASRDQRLALLQGLMDSDGTASGGNRKAPRCCFDVMNETLARDVLFLVRSLGFKATIREDVAKIYGRPIGPVWSVSFTAYQEDEIFRLSRRGACLPPRRHARSRTNAIVACDEVPSVPTVCIQVDAPSRLFLAGEGLTPTHNSTLAAFLLLLHLCGPEAKANSQLFSAAQSLDQAGIVFNLAAKIVKMSPVLNHHVTVRYREKQLYCEGLGTLYRALSAEVSTAYGLSPVFIVHDELGLVKGPRSELYEALETATGAQAEPLSVIISTQAKTDADLLSVLIDDALAEHDPHTVVTLYTAPLEADPFDAATIRLANPAMGDFLNEKEVLSMAKDAKRMPSREADFRNLVLNQRVETSAPFVTRTLWQSCGTPPLPIDGVPVYGGLDLSEVADLTALVLVGKVANVWQVHPTFWLPMDGLLDKSHKDRVPYDMWHKHGQLVAAPGKSIDYEYVAAHLKDVFGRYKVHKIAFDRWNFKHLKPCLIRAGFTERQVADSFVEFGQGFQSMSPALRSLEGEILNGRIAHGNHPVLAMCAANAVVQTDPAGNKKLTKHKSAGRIDGMIALTMAMGSVPMEETKPKFQMFTIG